MRLDENQFHQLQSIQTLGRANSRRFQLNSLEKEHTLATYLGNARVIKN